jgi:hypothetical protein
MDVTPDQELMLIFGALHLVALVMAGVLFVMFLRSDTTDGYRPPDEEEDDGPGGGNDRTDRDPARPRPGGGLRLPADAVPPRVRLRGHEKLADTHPRRDRRPAREPGRTPVHR